MVSPLFGYAESELTTVQTKSCDRCREHDLDCFWPMPGQDGKAKACGACRKNKTGCAVDGTHIGPTRKRKEAPESEDGGRPRKKGKSRAVLSESEDAEAAGVTTPGKVSKETSRASGGDGEKKTVRDLCALLSEVIAEMRRGRRSMERGSEYRTGMLERIAEGVEGIATGMGMGKEPEEDEGEEESEDEEVGNAEAGGSGMTAEEKEEVAGKK